MNTTLRHIFLTILCSVSLATLNAQVTAENCGETSAAQGWPSYYCDCKFNYHDFALPLDIEISDSTWFKASLSDLSQGLSAYLYSDCDMSFDVYVLCTSKEPKYQAVFTRNQTNSIDSQTIKERLEENGYGDVDATFYICIAPIYGFGGRLLANTMDKAFHTTCDDPLHLFPGMTMLSQATNDVYVVDPNDIPYGENVVIQWTTDDNAPCHLSVARGTCNATPFEEYTFNNASDRFVLSAALIDEAWEAEEYFYLHFSHDATATGTIRCLASNYQETITDTTICQGKVFRYEDITATTSGIYYYDTIQTSLTSYHMYGYNVVFSAPELQYDTLALRYDQLPYDYRGQTINAFGDYDLLLQAPDECDEHIALHVRHNLTTIANVIDTTLCAGSAYKDANDRYYDHEVSLVDSLWQGRDTVLVVYTNVHFNPMDTVHETKKYTAERIKKGVRLYQQIFKDFGDYTINTFDKDGCQMIVYLHIQHSFITLTKTINELVCVGKVYTHSNGDIYTSSTTIVDSMWTNVDTLTITSTHVTFTSPEAIPDTLALKQTELPYTYRGQDIITTFGDYDLTIRTSGECDERYLLHVYHAIDTLYETVSETLCQGKVFTYKGIDYTSNTAFVDTAILNVDTCVITSVSVVFTAPDISLDTLGLKHSDLPYTYRNHYTIPVGGLNQEYDVLIHTLGNCDEHYRLYVYHDIDTLYETLSETLCQGKVFTYKGIDYTSNTAFVDTAILNVDTCVITSVSVVFTAPDISLDTLGLKHSDLPYTYRNHYTIPVGGLNQEYDVLIHTLGNCDEHYRLYVYHDIDTLYETLSETLCQGKVFTYNGVEYTSSTTFADTLQRDADTYIITSVSVTFTAPEAIPDTLALKQTELPYTYRGQDIITTFGDYDLTIRTSGECDERYLLHLYHDIDTLYMNVDTTLCEGRIFIHNELEYTQPAILLDSNWLNMDTWQITTIDIAFTTPDMEYDTIVVKTEELLAGYYYEPADTMVYAAGDYFYKILTYNDCTRHLTLTVNEELTSAVDNLPCTEQPRLIMRNGVVYIIRGKECFTILGMKIDNNKITTNIE